MGLATARALAEAGAAVVLADVDKDGDVVAGDEKAYANLAKNVPIGRAGRPEEIASVILWLCSPGASYVVGRALTVDGGMTMLR
ncbi:MAG TPA: SDR family oxidoreductase [Chthoniobacterales bacterium]